MELLVFFGHYHQPYKINEEEQKAQDTNLTISGPEEVEEPTSLYDRCIYTLSSKEESESGVTEIAELGITAIVLLGAMFYLANRSS